MMLRRKDVIAIISAGLEGYSYVITLEKHGNQKDIFKKRKNVGDRPIVGEAMSPILHAPIDDPPADNLVLTAV